MPDSGSSPNPLHRSELLHHDEYLRRGEPLHRCHLSPPASLGLPWPPTQWGPTTVCPFCRRAPFLELCLQSPFASPVSPFATFATIHPCKPFIPGRTSPIQGVTRWKQCFQSVSRSGDPYPPSAMVKYPELT